MLRPKTSSCALMFPVTNFPAYQVLVVIPGARLTSPCGHGSCVPKTSNSGGPAST